MLLGVSRQSVTKWEAEKSYPEMDKLIKMCQIFECSLDDLVQGDLTDRDPVPVAATVPSGPATDVCGYDEHMRKYSKHVPTGVASFVLGIVGLVFFEETSGTPGFFNGGIASGWSELLGLGALFLGVLTGIGILVSSGMEHSAFVKAHPFIEDFYTEEERLQARQLLVKGVIAGLGSIFAGVMLCAFVERESGAGWAAAAVLFLLVAIGVWMIVYASMMYDRIDIADYNRSAAEELEMRTSRVSMCRRRCAMSCAPQGAHTRRSRQSAASSCSLRPSLHLHGFLWARRLPGRLGIPSMLGMLRSIPPSVTSGSLGWLGVFCVPL